MTRSYGGGPDWQRKNKQPDLRQSEPQPELREHSEPRRQNELQQQDDPDSSWDSRLDRLSRYAAHEETIKAVRVDFGKRFVALGLDLVASYILASILAVVPFLNAFVGQNLVMTLFLLVRDYLFAGRGVGKNLMGLQVVDVRNGHPCTLFQSIKRNLIILGPLLVLQVINMGLHIFNVVATQGAALPNTDGMAQFLRWLNETIPMIVNGAGGAYVILVIPYEAYRVYHRADGRRFGDQLAGTAIIEAPMDFSHPIPRQ